MWYSVDVSLFADVSNNHGVFSPWPSRRSDHDPSKLREPLAQHSRQSLASQKEDLNLQPHLRANLKPRIVIGVTK